MPQPFFPDPGPDDAEPDGFPPDEDAPGPEQGRSDIPGEVGGFGLLDGDDARDLAAAAARHPRTRWCVTALNPDGTAAAHGCLPGRHPPRGTGPPGTEPPSAGPPGTEPPSAGPPGTEPPPGHDHPPSGTGLITIGPPGILSIPLTPITRGTCDHAHAEAGYRPSRKLAHLIRARNTRCTAPGCDRPAARCDLDHTVAWQQGGLTCECDLAPLCRHHHRCKQAEGWSLAQPEPGVLIWSAP